MADGQQYPLRARDRGVPANDRSRQMTRRRVLGLGAGTLATLALAACGASATPTLVATAIPPTTAAGAGATATGAATRPAGGGATVELNFFYPVAAAGPIASIVNGYVEEFNKTDAGIKVTPSFTGSYTDTLTKVQTTIDGGGAPPEVAIMLSTDLYTLKDADYIVPLDDLVATAGPGLIADFYDAFMLNSKADGKVYGLPFQRSTPVLYYNKDLFREVGLDPEQAPKDWAAMVEAAKKLNKPDGARWGIEIPSDGFPYWVFQGMAIGNGKNFVGDVANKVFFNDPAVVDALQAWVNLGAQDKVAPASIVVWATTPADFTSGKAGMIWHTTGSLTNILKEAKFPVGVGFLPGLKQNGAPTGGGNFYLFKKTAAEKRAAAFKFIQFMAQPEMQARWTIDTGYVAPRKSAWDTQKMKDFVAKTPQVLVARDQLPFASKELATHSGSEISKVFSDALQAALTGKSAPKAALDAAQTNAEKILSQFKD
jgi:sn-glycerol 3-phosphate transport system substrate-binding protein